jgi:hypothetical protein
LHPVAPMVLEAQRRLQQLLGLSPAAAARAVAETLDAFQLDVDEYIATRHAEMRTEGASNQEIFDRIVEELKTMRFAAKRLTLRQIRRRIYG